MTLALSILALLLALIALGLVLLPYWQRARRKAHDVSNLPEDLAGLRHEVAALRAEGAQSLRHISVVRYDAFDASVDRSSGGQLSWSMALVDDRGNGALVTSIHSRTEARTYAKSVSGWRSTQSLSPEETEALAQVRQGR